MTFVARPGERAQRLRELRAQYWGRLLVRLNKRKLKWQEEKRRSWMKFAMAARVA
jgi:hypothetical protein